MKKLANLTAALTLAVAFSMPATGYANDVKTESYSNVIVSDSETAIIEDFTAPVYVPYSSHLVIKGETIQDSGTSWDQPRNYNAYRVWVENDTNETMTVTVSYSTGWWSKETHTMKVGANSGKSLTVNNAKEGKHKISYTTKSGDLNGSVSVRVSDEDL